MGTAEQTRSRIENIDFARGIAIIAVTIGHVVGAYHLGNTWISYWVYSFELPAFFLLSGWLLEGSSKDYTLKTYLRKQARSILYPYFMFSAVYTIVFSLLSLRTGMAALFKTLVSNLLYTVSTEGLGALWFLPTFFVATVIAFILNAWDKGTVWGLAGSIVVGSALSIAVSKLPFSNGDTWDVNKLLWYLLVFISRWLISASLILLGRFLRRMREKTTGTLKKRGGSATATIFLAMLLLALGFVLAIIQNGTVDLHFAKIRNPVFFYSSAVFTVAGLMLIGKHIRIKWINYLGINSIVVMFCQLVQHFACSVVNEKVFKVYQLPEWTAYFASFITMFFVLACSAIASYVIDHNRFFNMLLYPPKRCN